jgi:hypothetical protein
MKRMLRIAIVSSVFVAMFIADGAVLRMQWVPEAQAIFGVRRRAWRRGAIVGFTAGAATAGAAAYHQPYAPPPQPAPPPPTAPPPPAASGAQLPLGTVVQALPPGCSSTPVGGVSYYYCGGNFYRAVFQGNQLVYVTAQPK